MLLFASDREYALFLRMIADAKREFDFMLHMFCIMPNHFHLLIECAYDLMSEFVGQIEARYAGYFNQTRARAGHVFQGRFRSPEVFDSTYYRNVVRYISMNPVRAGLADECGEWPWSGHKQLLAPTPYSLVDRDRVLGRLGETEETALANYQAHLQAAGYSDALIALRMFPSIRERSIFAPWAESGLEAALQELARKSLAESNASPGRLGVGPGTSRAATETFCSAASALGFSNVAIADFLGCSQPSVSRMVAKVLEPA